MAPRIVRSISCDFSVLSKRDAKPWDLCDPKMLPLVACSHGVRAKVLGFGAWPTVTMVGSAVTDFDRSESSGGKVPRFRVKVRVIAATLVAFRNGRLKLEVLYDLLGFYVLDL